MTHMWDLNHKTQNKNYASVNVHVDSLKLVLQL